MGRGLGWDRRSSVPEAADGKQEWAAGADFVTEMVLACVYCLRSKVPWLDLTFELML